jgi:hypothetical protein
MMRLQSPQRHRDAEEIKARRSRAHLRGSARDIASILASLSARAAQSGSNACNLALGCLPEWGSSFLARIMHCNIEKKSQKAVFDAKN